MERRATYLRGSNDTDWSNRTHTLAPLSLPEAWSVEEVAATVADYFAMLEAELRGESYNKAEHNRQLQVLLNGRSGQAIEFKHANISAVLIEFGLPYIAGYKPRGNYQQQLRHEIEHRLQIDSGIESIVAATVEEPEVDAPRVVDYASVVVPRPQRERRERSYERARAGSPIRKRINYLEREARNASLGQAGERFVLAVEHRRLWEIGARHLADRIEHVSESRGDGLGFDILSFEADGRERLVEVKTTRYGAHTPFFASSNEVAVSSDRAESYSLYRVFGFRADPKLFIVSGALREEFDLEPIEFRASLA